MAREKKEKILFVDDEESILDVLGEYFTRRGYKILTAKNGIEATKILDQEAVDCCFTDINMPEMDGLELAEYIRRKDNTIPVIIMTGYPSLENALQTLKNGVVDFLIKPMNLSQMELCLERVLRERKLFIENILLQKELEGKKRIEKLNQELMSKVEELHILNRIMKYFIDVDNSADVFKRVADTTIEITHADVARFYVVDPASRQPFEVAVSYSERIRHDLDGTENNLATPACHNRFGPEADKMNNLIVEAAADPLPLLIADANPDILPGIRSFMAVPLQIRQEAFGVLTASVIKNNIRFGEKDLYYLSFMTQNAAHAIENLALYENISENLLSNLYAFVRALEARDPYTQQHSSRVTAYAIAIGRELGLTKEEIDILRVAGHLHDVGKIGIRDAILLKPARLTDEEYQIIKQHPIIGASIVGQIGLWEREQDIIRHHHERYDGSGYPDQLKKDQIPLLARILSVADVYDALASDRAYRKRLDPAEIKRIMDEGAGTKFDPEIIKIFNTVYEKNKILA